MSMDPEVVSRLEALCRELGLDPALARRVVAEAAGPEDPDSVRRERDRLLAMEAEIMGILGSTSRDRIVHDLRNVLNDLTLLQELSGRDSRKRGE
jgi:hypothetical protein